MRQFRSGAAVFHKAAGGAPLNGPPRAHCTHCRGSCLAHKHASHSLAQSHQRTMNDRNLAGYTRTFDNHVLQWKKGPVSSFLRPLLLEGLLENVSPSLYLGGNLCVVLQAQRWMGNACWSMDTAGITGFLLQSGQSVAEKYPLSGKGFPVVGWTWLSDVKLNACKRTWRVEAAEWRVNLRG